MVPSSVVPFMAVATLLRRRPQESCESRLRASGNDRQQGLHGFRGHAHMRKRRKGRGSQVSDCLLPPPSGSSRSTAKDTNSPFAKELQEDSRVVSICGILPPSLAKGAASSGELVSARQCGFTVPGPQATSLIPAALRSSAALSIASQGNRLRPKWP